MCVTERGQLDVTHAVTANFGVGDFDTASFAGDAAMAHAFVLAAIAFPVLGWSKNALAKETVFLRLERTVVDRLGLGHFAVRPAEDALRRRNPDLYIVKPINTCRHFTYQTSSNTGLSPCSSCQLSLYIIVRSHIRTAEPHPNDCNIVTSSSSEASSASSSPRNRLRLRPHPPSATSVRLGCRFCRSSTSASASTPTTSSSRSLTATAAEGTIGWLAEFSQLALHADFAKWTHSSQSARSSLLPLRSSDRLRLRRLRVCVWRRRRRDRSTAVRARAP